MSINDEYMTVPEVAKQLGYSLSVAYWWIRTNHLPSERIGNRVYVRRSNLIGFIPPQQVSGQGRPRSCFSNSPIYSAIPKGYLTIRKASVIAGVSYPTFRFWVLDKIVKSKMHKKSRLILISRAHLDRFMQKSALYKRFRSKSRTTA